MFLEFIQNNILLVAIALISGGMFFWPYLRPSGKPLTPVLATQLINREDAKVLDLRDEGEFAAGHLPGACHIPFKDLQKKNSELASFKEKPLILVCSSDIKTGQAYRQLTEQGFSRLHHLEGGILAWERAGLPVKREKTA